MIFWQGKNDGQGDWFDYDHLDVTDDGWISWSDVSSVVSELGQSC